LVGRYHRSERYVQKMRRLQAAAGLHRKMRWLGRRNNVHEYMAAMDQVLVTSTEEPFGLVALEAQLAGKPLIATNVGGLPEIVQHEQSGLLIPARSSTGIIESVERLYQDRELAGRLAATGRDRASQRFTSERLTEEVVAVYREVLRRRGRLSGTERPDSMPVSKRAA
jgi:glycosyltransferase involved in cell wall biosynthesis